MKALIFISIFITSGYLFAQEQKVSEIRKIYNEYQNKITNESKDGSSWLPSKITVSFDEMQRAIGLVNFSKKFFYDINDDVVEDKEKAQFIHDRILRKVESETGAISYKIYTEYFYDSKGNFLFYYAKNTLQPCAETRMYFDNGKLIKIKINSLKDLENQSNCDYVRYEKDFSTDDRNNAQIILKMAKQLKDVFKYLQ